MSRDSKSLWNGEWADRNGEMEKASRVFNVMFAKVYQIFFGNFEGLILYKQQRTIGSFKADERDTGYFLFLCWFAQLFSLQEKKSLHCGGKDEEEEEETKVRNSNLEVTQNFGLNLDKWGWRGKDRLKC